MGREDLEKQTIKSIITGKDLQPGEFEYDWQEFILKRMDSVNEEPFEGVNLFIKRISNNEIRNDIGDDIGKRELKGRYISFNFSVFNKIKDALTALK
jgi:hypothetical protein